MPTTGHYQPQPEELPLVALLQSSLRTLASHCFVPLRTHVLRNPPYTPGRCEARPRSPKTGPVIALARCLSRKLTFAR